MLTTGYVLIVLLLNVGGGAFQAISFGDFGDKPACQVAAVWIAQQAAETHQAVRVTCTPKTITEPGHG